MIGGSPSRRLLLATVVCLLLALGGRARAQSASTPAGLQGLNIAPPPIDSTSVENKSIRETSPGTAGQADGATSFASPGFDTVHVICSLGLVIVLIFGLRFLARKYFALPTVKNSPLVKVLARSPVSPKQQVLLLHVGRRILVVADSGAAMQPLAQITDADEIAGLLGQLNSNANFANSPFGPLFSRLRRDFDSESDGAPNGAVETESPSAEMVETGEVTQTTQELQGLMEKVRLVSRRLGKTA